MLQYLTQIVPATNMTEFWYKKKKSSFKVAVHCDNTDVLTDLFGFPPKGTYHRLVTSKRKAKKLLNWLQKHHGPVDVHKGELPPDVNTVHLGDCLDRLKELPDNSVDLVVTDPPYGLTSIDPQKPGGGSGKSGFMGKKWDAAVPPVEVWQECLRVLKPGAFAFIMSSPRLDCLGRMALNLEEAGFVTGYSHLTWITATGFPKSQNLSKAADKRAGVKREVVGKRKHPTLRDDAKKTRRGKNNFHGQNVVKEEWDITAPATPEAKALNGAYAGAQLKPALEPILCVMVPLEERTYLDQALKNGKGCTWLDDGRIPTTEKVMCTGLGFKTGKFCGAAGKGDNTMQGKQWEMQQAGRFPANVLVEGDSLNDGTSSKSPSTYKRNADGMNQTAYGEGMGQTAGTVSVNYGDAGSPSRYFDLDAWFEKRLQDLPEPVRKVFPNLLVPKPSKREKNAGCENLPKKAKPEMGEFKDNPGRSTPKSSPTPRANHHPTCKPVKLLTYLITLGSRPGDIVLDPYLGSGTTGVAAVTSKRRFIGIEKEPEYVDISVARIKHAITQVKKVPKKMKRLFKRK